MATLEEMLLQPASSMFGGGFPTSQFPTTQPAQLGTPSLDPSMQDPRLELTQPGQLSTRTRVLGALEGLLAQIARQGGIQTQDPSIVSEARRREAEKAQLENRRRLIEFEGKKEARQERTRQQEREADIARETGQRQQDIIRGQFERGVERQERQGERREDIAREERRFSTSRLDDAAQFAARAGAKVTEGMSPEEMYQAAGRAIDEQNRAERSKDTKDEFLKTRSEKDATAAELMDALTPDNLTPDGVKAFKRKLRVLYGPDTAGAARILAVFEREFGDDLEAAEAQRNEQVRQRSIAEREAGPGMFAQVPTNFAQAAGFLMGPGGGPNSLDSLGALAGQGGGPSTGPDLLKLLGLFGGR